MSQQTSDAASLVAESEEVPFPESADLLVELPGGWIDPAGNVQTKAEIKELTGADEEALSRTSVKGQLDLAKFMRTILDRGLVAVGGYPINAKMCDALLVGDRDAILLGVRIATYGNEFETSLTCGECSETRDVAYELDTDITERPLADPEVWFRKVELRHGRTAELHLVTVLDQAVALADPARTSAEANTIILGRCVRTIDSEPCLGVQSMLKLGAGDRRILQTYLVETQPGPQMGEVKGQCPACNGDVTISLSMPALFL